MFAFGPKEEKGALLLKAHTCPVRLFSKVFAVVKLQRSCVETFCILILLVVVSFPRAHRLLFVCGRCDLLCGKLFARESFICTGLECSAFEPRVSLAYFTFD